MAASDLIQRLSVFAPRICDTALGAIEYRTSGPAPGRATHVLLHGIGSGSASWLAQLEAASKSGGQNGVLAWEAPGYGNSAPVVPDCPGADDYAARLWAWLDALGVHQSVTLVGHSLGALMAAKAALMRPQRVRALILLSPAQGYARANAAEREKKLSDRLATLAQLGPQGMAQSRGAAMLSAQASPEQVAYIKWVMAQIRPAGYSQAARLLAQGDLLGDVALVSSPVRVASGAADTITPMEKCQEVAARAQVSWQNLGPVGHACAIEAADTVNTLLGFNLDV